MSGSGGPEIFDGTVFAAGYWGSGGLDRLGAYGGGAAGGTPATLTGTLTRVGDTVSAVIGGVTLTLRAYSDIAVGTVFTTTDLATFYVFTRVLFDPAQLYPLSYTVAGDSGLSCFVAGTRIAAEGGEVPVERLRVGDQVQTLGRRGLQRVRWLGRRRFRSAAAEAWPVRIRAGAFAEGQPARDLLLSPDHAVLAGEGLIPVRYLINGATIAPAPMPQVEYWHVELTDHALLLAEGLAAESYLDTGNRGGFDGERGAGASAEQARRIWSAHGAAPLLLDAAEQVAARRHLLARADLLGHASTDDPGLRVVADGGALRLRRDGFRWRATVPPGTVGLRLLSRSAVPAEMRADSTDCRRLGVAVTRLLLDGCAVPPDDPRRAAGWHAPELGLHWTDGDAVLLCGGEDRPRRLEITAAPLLQYRLRPPPPWRLAA